MRIEQVARTPPRRLMQFSLTGRFPHDDANSVEGGGPRGHIPKACSSSVTRTSALRNNDTFCKLIGAFCQLRTQSCALCCSYDWFAQQTTDSPCPYKSNPTRRKPLRYCGPFGCSEFPIEGRTRGEPWPSQSLLLQMPRSPVQVCVLP